MGEGQAMTGLAPGGSQSPVPVRSRADAQSMNVTCAASKISRRGASRRTDARRLVRKPSVVMSNSPLSTTVTVSAVTTEF